MRTRIDNLYLGGFGVRSWNRHRDVFFAEKWIDIDDLKQCEERFVTFHD